MEIIERVYPSSETLLLKYVQKEDLFEFIFHGFALVTDKGKSVYVSYNFEKPLLIIPQNPETDELFRQRNQDCSNISSLIRLCSKLKHIQYHYGDNPKSWEMIKKELGKDEFSATINDFRLSVETVIERMFPNFS